jgi:hypothetical protein
VDVDGTLAYVVRDDVEALEAAAPSEAVRLLPAHDQWVIGPGTSDAHVTPPVLRDPITRKANPVVVGGVVRGTWTRHGDDLTLAWCGEGHRPDEAIRREADRLADIVGRDLRVVLAQ